ncbi:MAG: SusE domain-containing protein [Saprospiraceae bacterium]
MKNKLVFSALWMGLLLTVACNLGEFKYDPAVLLGDRPVITAPLAGSSFVLLEADADKKFSPITWTAADFGYQAAVTYAVELDKAGNDFKDAVTIGQSNRLDLSDLSIGQLNNVLLTKGLPGEVAADLEIRVKASVSSLVDAMYSDPVRVKITPYTVFVVYPQLQVPGSYQGWSPANNETVIFSIKSDKRFEGYIYFSDDNTEYKYTDGPSWSVNWGDDGADGTLNPNGANIVAPTRGMQRLNVDLNSLTHSRVQTNWGLIGSATPDGWNSDQDMIYDPVGRKLTITLDLVQGEIKFRANDDWAINFGDDGGDKKLEYGGANIPINEAGNYTIDLILSGAIYTYNIKKN